MAAHRVRISDFLFLEVGQEMPNQQRLEEGTYPVVGAKGIEGWCDRALVSGPGIVIGRTGTHFRKNMKWIESDFWPKKNIYYVRSLPGINLRWIYHLMRMVGIDRLGRHTRDEEGRLTHNTEHKLLNAKIAVPSEPEQKRIAALLDLAAGVYSDCLSSGNKMHDTIRTLYPRMFGDLFLNPRGWPERRLEELFVIERIQEARTKRLKSHIGKKVNDKIDPTVVEKGNLLLSSVVSRFNKICLTIAERDYTPIHCETYLFKAKGSLSVICLYGMLLSAHRELPGYLLTGFTRIGHNKLASFKVPVPPAAELNKYEEQIKNILEIRENQRRVYQLSRQLYDSLNAKYYLVTY